MRSKKKFIVLGGGIKGAATAAVASLFDDFQVVLLERDSIASGTTSTNHGRLHLGTAGWDVEPSQFICRRRLASEVIRKLPNTLVSRKRGLYCFEQKKDADRFQEIADRDKISYGEAELDKDIRYWFDKNQYRRIYSVPEHSFNPARLAGRFAQTCQNLGGQILVNKRVSAIKRMSGKNLISFSDGSSISADYVVNTLSKWCSSIDLPLKAPQLEIDWFQWRLLCLQTSEIRDIPKLERVLMVIDQSKSMPSVIPHNGWLTLDFKATPVEKVSSPENFNTNNWAHYNPLSNSDRLNLSAVAEAFKPIQNLTKESINNHLYSLTGVHGRRKNAPTGSQNYIDTSIDFPNYFIAFGGQASTSLLDAFDTVSYIRSFYKLVCKSHTEMLLELIQNFSHVPIQGYTPMRWEKSSE